jgi:hypothetical protein
MPPKPDTRLQITRVILSEAKNPEGDGLYDPSEYSRDSSLRRVRHVIANSAAE